MNKISQNWKYATYEGAEEYQKMAWRKLSWRQKLQWLDEARRFTLKMREAMRMETKRGKKK